MEPRGTKRKHNALVHGAVALELTKLNNDSAKLNNDMRSSKEDFSMMCKSMTDRQAEILTLGLFVEEQHRYFTASMLILNAGYSCLLYVFIQESY